MEATQRRDEVGTASTSPPAPTLTVAAVARRLGVAPPTLRTWDRRYGLGPSAHTAGAHRRYSPADVARLMVMRRLTLEGVSPADAAKIAVATSVTADGRPMHTPADGLSFDDVDPAAQVESPGVTLAPSADRDPAIVDAPSAADRAGYDQESLLPGDAPLLSWSDGDPWPDDAVEPSDRTGASTGGVAAGPAVRTAPERAHGDDPPADVDPDPDVEPEVWSGVLRSVGNERSTPGGGRVVALPDGTPQNRGLARAAMSLDTYETHRILRESISRDGVIVTWNTMIMPVLRALGERTLVTGDGIDVEHAFSEVILGVMRSTTFSLQRPRSPATVLLACADADYHSLPLHALAAALAEREIPTRMLGSGLPAAALAAAVRRTGPAVVVLFARMPGADAGDTEALRRQRPAPALVLAGPGWNTSSIPSMARTAASLIEAVDEVLLAVHA